jgi:hypothetical protein
MIEDVVRCGSPLSVASRLHLHPDCAIESMTADSAQVRFPAGQFTIRFHGLGTLGRGQSSYCPEFGRELGRPVILWTMRVSGSARFGFTIELAR